MLHLGIQIFSFRTRQQVEAAGALVERAFRQMVLKKQEMGEEVCSAQLPERLPITVAVAAVVREISNAFLEQTVR